MCAPSTFLTFPPVLEVRPDGYLDVREPSNTFSTFPSVQAPSRVVSPVAQSPTVEPVAQPGFAWSTAGVGFAIGLLAAAALGAAMRVARHRRTAQTV